MQRHIQLYFLREWRWSIKYWILSLLIFPTLSYGKTYTLDSAIATALKYSPAMKIQKNSTHQVSLQRRSIYGSALPQLSASYDVQNFLKKPSFGGFSLNSTWERTFGVTVTQALYGFGAVSNAIDAAKAALDVSKLSEAMTKREIEYAVKLSFYSIRLAQEQLDIVKESLKNAKNNLNILKNSFSSGRPPQQDHIRLRTDVSSRTSQVADAQKKLDQAKLTFKILLGIPLESVTEIAFEPIHNAPPPIPQSAFSKNLLNQQPQLLLFDKQILYSESLAKAQESKIYPSLGLFYNFSISERSNNDIFDTQQQIDTSVIGLSLSWNIWNGGTNRAEIEKARAVKYGAELMKIQEKNKIVKIVKEKIIEYNSIKSNLKNDIESVRLAKESFRVSQNRFRTGKTSVTELNSSESQLYQALLSRALHEFQLNESRAAIHKIVSEKGEE